MKNLLVVLTVVALALPAAAQTAPPRLGAPPPTPDPVFGELELDNAQATHVLPERAKEIVIRTLGLTEAQQAEWETMLANLRATLAPLREQLKNGEEALRDLLRQSNPDPTRIGELVLASKQVREQMGAAHQAYLQGFEGMLTLEQKAKLAFLRRAQQVVPLLPAFKMFGLLPPPR
jgi:Spy/CpxP family protein refolding chaperone